MTSTQNYSQPGYYQGMRTPMSIDMMVTIQHRRDINDELSLLMQASTPKEYALLLQHPFYY